MATGLSPRTLQNREGYDESRSEQNDEAQYGHGTATCPTLNRIVMLDGATAFSLR